MRRVLAGNLTSELFLNLKCLNVLRIFKTADPDKIKIGFFFVRITVIVILGSRYYFKKMLTGRCSDLHLQASEIFYQGPGMMVQWLNNAEHSGIPYG